MYNKEEYIEECIKSLLNQTYEAIEIILVDDGSSDRSGEICDQYALSDDRIKVIHTVNGGISKARNVGLENAQGEFIAFCDADDAVEPMMYERLMEVITRFEADMVICGNSRLCGSIKTVDQYALPEGIVSREDYYSYMYEGRREMFLPFVVMWTKLFRRELLSCRTPFFPEGHIYEDSWTIHYLVENARRIYWINDPLYCWRITDGSITHSGFSLRMFDDFRAQLDRLDYLRDKYGNSKFYAKMIIQCLDNGAQYYSRAIAEKKAGPNEICDYYSEVRKAISEYGRVRRAPVRSRIRWFLFNYIPKVYCVFVRIRRGIGFGN